MKMENEKMKQFDKVLMDILTGKVKAKTKIEEIRIKDESNCWGKIARMYLTIFQYRYLYRDILSYSYILFLIYSLSTTLI